MLTLKHSRNAVDSPKSPLVLHTGLKRNDTKVLCKRKDCYDARSTTETLT